MRARSTLRAASAVAFGSVLTACTVVVDPNDGPIRCTTPADAADPCPEGLTCRDGTCMPVAPECPARETRCDGLDDDCDRQVDEQDEGASPLCPEGESCLSGRCVDPRDCTLEINRCAGDERCDTTLDPPSCVAGGCGGDDARCAEGEECDPVTNACVAARGLGSRCASDRDCPVGHCVRRESMGLEPPDEGICALACCQDADCPEASVCWAPGNGARLCVPAELVGTSRGAGQARAPCSAHDDCASGVCLGEDGCLGNCSDDGHCGESAICGSGYVPRAGAQRWQPMCVAPAGSRAAGERCRSDEECRFGSCINMRCGGACSTTADCPTGMYCGWAVDPTTPESYFQTCLLRENWQDHGAGEPCDADWQCIDAACVAGRCAPTCCSDADCATDTCRPVRANVHFEMHCVL